MLGVHFDLKAYPDFFRQIKFTFLFLPIMRNVYYLDCKLYKKSLLAWSVLWQKCDKRLHS